jgi:single-strand DNA-binding protein
MAQSLNKVLLIGRAGKDPVEKEFDGSKVVNLSLATSESWVDKQSGQRQERTQWANIAIWNQALGEIAMKYVKKGSLIYVEGQLETRSWGAGADKKYATEVVLRPFGSDLQLLGSSPERPESGPAQKRAPQREPSGRR